MAWQEHKKQQHRTNTFSKRPKKSQGHSFPTDEAGSQVVAWSIPAGLTSRQGQETLPMLCNYLS